MNVLEFVDLKLKMSCAFTTVKNVANDHVCIHIRQDRQRVVSLGEVTCTKVSKAGVK